MATIMVVSKFALDALPNIELISLLVIVYTLELPRLALPAIYTYVGLYGLLNGFGVWWFPQLYIWLALYVAVRLFRRWQGTLPFAALSALFGLSYGALYALSYGAVNGAAAGVAWWITGIPFDLLHGGGNLICALLLLRPLRFALKKCRELYLGGPGPEGEDLTKERERGTITASKGRKGPDAATGAGEKEGRG